MAEAATQKDRRGALVRAAYNQIAEHGFEGLRTREVAGEAGVNIATLHYYFPTKEKLIEGVVEHAMERFRTTLAPHGSPSDQLRNHLRSVKRLVQEEIMRETNEGWHRTVRSLLRRAVKEGNLRPEMDSDEVAAMVVATLRNLTLPVASTGARGDQALRQLERWLGVGGSVRAPARKHSSN